MFSLPQNVYAANGVELVLLLLNLSLTVTLGVWLVKRSIEQGERLARLDTILNNHYRHRFEKLKHVVREKHNDFRWDDDLEEEQDVNEMGEKGE